MITLDDIREQLRIPSEFHGGTGEHALPLIDMMKECARDSVPFAGALNRWLDNGGLVLLRDDLLGQFRDHITDLCPDAARFPYPFNECWTSIDTAWLNCAVRAGIRPPYTDTIPKEDLVANLLHDPFRELPPYNALYRLRGKETRKRFRTRDEAIRELSAAGYSV